VRVGTTLFNTFVCKRRVLAKKKTIRCIQYTKYHKTTLHLFSLIVRGNNLLTILVSGNDFPSGPVLIFPMTWQTIVYHRYSLIIFRDIDGRLTPLDVRQVAVINFFSDLRSEPAFSSLKYFFLIPTYTRTLFQSC
jgi:hypothetical protein